MKSNPEVIIVGAGPAGIAAAIKLARAGVRVLVLEGADFAGAENWSGCVYHGDAWARPDMLGPAWADAPKERRIIARSLFFHDGLQAVGFEARANAGNDYGEAWTVLRPKLDRWLAARAIDFGVTLLPATTVVGLRYNGQRVIGVETERGPVEADVVFLAEGDAAGLVARESFERLAHPHYTQGIKAVFRLAPAEIERRFGLAPGEGVAQEWVLRNGNLAGREVPLNVTAFLYTNHDSLSVGVALPLSNLAQHGVADHAHLLERVLKAPGISGLLDGAQRVAYGAKVIRAGGVGETPEWVRDGLAIGGGALGIGSEFPYPNFIGPAITSGIAFADAVLRLRGNNSSYSKVELAREYSDRLRSSDDYANAELLRRWPAAIHNGALLFQHVPALLGQLADAETLPSPESRAQRERALAAQMATLRADIAQALPLMRGMQAKSPSGARKVPPLDVRFFRTEVDGRVVPFTTTGSRLLDFMSTAIGHFYGRRLSDMRARLGQIYGDLRWRHLAIAIEVGRLGYEALAGGARFLSDLAAYKFKRISLRTLLLRPYHLHQEMAQRALNWSAARRSPLSSLTWIAPLGRHRPDARHISVPLTIDTDAAKQLRNVCPAEVYVPTSKWGGAASQYENCIKCESCRVTMPEIDWNRTSGHRLVYRVPGDGRYGLDGSTTTDLAPIPIPSVTIATAEQEHWQLLLRALSARPAIVDSEHHRRFRDLWQAIPASRTIRQRHDQIGVWLRGRHYGWAENEVRALLAQPGGPSNEATRSIAEHRKVVIAHRGRDLAAYFNTARLRELIDRPWQESERRRLLNWIEIHREHREEALEWLAGWSPALAWIAINHYVAEACVGRPIHDRLSAPIGRIADGGTNWVPGAALCFIDSEQRERAASRVVAHGAGLDAAQPVRYEFVESLPALSVTGELARGALSLAMGQLSSLRTRAIAYANERVQFRGDIKDREGREGIAKFGGVKMMLARIEHARYSLLAARSLCDRDPLNVLALIHDRMGVRMDAVPWLAGQLFGGMAYSEDDILAPRYRDALFLGQWPVSAEGEGNVARFQAQLCRSSLASRDEDYLRCLDFQIMTERPSTDPHASPVAAASAPTRQISPLVSFGRPQRLVWHPHPKFPYRSGSFIHGRTLSTDQLLLPEHFRRDPRLRLIRAQVLRLLRRGFRGPIAGEPYGRYIDRLHGVPPSDVALLRDFNAFATVVPETLGGKGWSKADYAVLNMLTMGRGDTSLGLLIMASTSIGTMPVILGLEKDLPRAQAELEASLADDRGWQQLMAGVEALLSMLEHPDPKRFKQRMTHWAASAQRMFMAPGSTLKYLARDFLLLLQKTADIAKTRDLEALRHQFDACRRALPALQNLLREEFAALPARRAAHERFLRFLGTGQISAFALTEPVAGSDTGGIQTRAVLRTVPVQPGPLGTYRFTPHEGDSTRLLLDATRLEFADRQVWYRLPEGGRATLDDSEWDLNANSGQRLLRVGAQTQAYDDIGTVISGSEGSVYRYWEITGNKMWITNGSVADRYCVYAQTELGETAFMLERRSEGLRIGPNENKLGQRASPTNELTFDRVRISTDQIIGFVGHGQVNALETLSVGRGGLVTGCATLIERALRECAEEWARHPELERAARFELERVQTLAARLVGLMDRADLTVGDFRIEAALSKYIASEGAHRVLLWLEQVTGPMAASTERLMEKWRRDARILNIYEGTNEIQRFLVLKDLPSLLAQTESIEVRDPALQNALATFRAFAAPRLQMLGSRAWQDPDLQAHWFPVVEWAGELYSWCALHERVRALEEVRDPADRAMLARLRAYLDYLARYVDALGSRVTEEFRTTESGGISVSGAMLTIARAALNEGRRTAVEPVCVGSLTGEWGVVVRSRVEWNRDGLSWAGWHEGDLAVLDRLLAWADRNPDLRVKAVVIAPRGTEDHLRRLQAAGAEVVHVVQPPGLSDATAVSAAIGTEWPALAHWAFATSADKHDDSFIRHLAAELKLERLEGVTALGSARRGLWVENGMYARHYLAAQRRIALLWSLQPSGRSDVFSVEAWLRALRSPLQTRETESALLVATPPMPRAATGDTAEAFAHPGGLVAWLQQQAVGGKGGTESAARLIDSSQTLAAATLWLAPASVFAHLQGDAALGLARDFAAPDFAAIAWAAPDVAPSVSRFINQPGLAGVWQLVTAGSARPNAKQLAPLVEYAKYLILPAAETELAAALAAALNRPLLDGVVARRGTRIVCAYDDYRLERELPEQAVMLAGSAYEGAPLADPAGAVVRLGHLPTLNALRADALARWRARAGATPRGLAVARVVIDVGLGIGDLDTYHALIPPLAEALHRLTGEVIEIGATRKVTQELKLLSVDRQIGQTGTAVAPALLFAIGVSGAPQHMSWIGKEAVVIAINRDPKAPIFRWHKENPGPRVVRCVGDARDWIPAIVRGLREAAPTVTAEVTAREKVN